MIKCFLDSLEETGTDRTRSLNWKPLIWVKSELELVLKMDSNNSGPHLLWSNWWDWRVRPAVEAPEELMEVWRALRVERLDVATLDEHSEGNHPCAAFSRGCGRCYSVLRRLLQSTVPLLVSFGSAGGRRRGNLRVGEVDLVAEGGTPGRKESPGWAGWQEG